MKENQELVNLKAEMVRYKIGYDQLGKSIGKSSQAARKRVSGEVGFEVSLLAKARDLFWPHCSLDYLMCTSPVEVGSDVRAIRAGSNREQKTCAPSA